MIFYAYLVLTAVIGIAAMFNGAIYPGIAGIVGPYLGLVAVEALAGSFKAGKRRHKILLLVEAVVLFGVALGLVYHSGYCVRLFALRLPGSVWCVIGVLAYISAEKKIPLGESRHEEVSVGSTSLGVASVTISPSHAPSRHHGLVRTEGTKCSGRVGWVILAGVLGVLDYLTGQTGGFAGFLVPFGIVVAVAGAFRLGPFEALMWTAVACLAIGFVGGYLGIITGNLGLHPNSILLDPTGYLFFAAIAVILGFLVAVRRKGFKPTVALLFTLTLLPVMAVLLLIIWFGEKVPNPVSPTALTFGKAINAFTSGRLLVWAYGQKR